jgi:hypothetical protein
MELKKKVPDTLKNSRYAQNRELINKAIHGTLASLYGEVAKDTYSLWESGTVKLNKVEEDRFIDVLEHIAKYGSPNGSLVKYPNPFAEGSLEGMEFDDEMYGGAVEYTLAFRSVLIKLPPELQEKQHTVQQMYDLILKLAPSGRTDLPERYVDAYMELAKKLDLQLRALQTDLLGISKKKKDMRK